MTAAEASEELPGDGPSGSAERRRVEILEATCDLLSEHGFADTRIADVANRLGISTGLVHYHFDTKDELFAEAFRHAAEAELAVLRQLAAADLPPRERLASVVGEFFPWDDFRSWRLWIEGWGEALRSTRFRDTSRELDEAWIGVLEDTLVAGMATGDFTCADPHDSAWRLSCLIEGLAIQQVAHAGTVDRDEMRRLVDVAVAAEVGRE